MVVPSIPAEVVALAEERADARLAKDYARADELKSRIEAAGWRVIDDGPAFELRPARQPDLVEDGQTFYGQVDSVPDRAHEPAATISSVIVIAPTAGAGLDIRPIAAHLPTGAELVVIAPRGFEVQGTATEVVRSVEPWTAGDALQAGIRRAGGAVIVVLDPARTPSGDVVAPLVEALGDPEVAIAGADGLSSVDLHRYQAADAADVTTVDSGCYAFRRADALARGPIDGRLRLAGSVAVWLGLVLRDEGPDTPPRRARVVDLPLAPAGPAADERAQARTARRDGYRISDRFRTHLWLGAQEPPQGDLVGDRAEGHEHGHDADQPAHASES